MNKDAKTLSQLMGLKLQMAGEIGDSVALGGFTKAGLNAYIGIMGNETHAMRLFSVHH